MKCIHRYMNTRVLPRQKRGRKGIEPLTSPTQRGHNTTILTAQRNSDMSGCLLGSFRKMRLCVYGYCTAFIDNVTCIREFQKKTYLPLPVAPRAVFCKTPIGAVSPTIESAKSPACCLSRRCGSVVVVNDNWPATCATSVSNRS